MGRDIEALKVAANEIRQLNQELEQRIRERTADLDRANCELRLSTERYEAAVRGSNDGIWDWNLVTQEDYFSERWCELLGYSREELKPHVDTWIAHLHPEEKDWVLSQAHAHLEKRVPYDLECRLRTKTGEFRWFHARGQAVWNERGQAVRMAGSISDITTRREAEAERLEYQEQLRAMAAKLLQSEEAERHRIACDIHDQVGQTLAACRIQLGHCIAEPGDRAFKTRAQDVRVLLEQAIQETRSLTFDLSPPVLHELGLAAAIHWLADKHSVAGGLHVGCQIIDDVVLHPDLQVLLFRITRELVLNAVKHASATRVEIRMTNSEDCVRIEVADDGVGFDPESVRVTRGRRGGFGLFSARDRLRFVGGRLELDSRPGQGTHAVILVPEVKSTPIADSRKP